MAILENRVRTKNNLIELSKFTLFFIKKSLVSTLILLSCFLLYFSYPKHIATLALDSIGKTLSLGTIVYEQSINSLKSLYSMASYFQDLEAENLKLRFEIASLSRTQELASSLKAENTALKEMLNVPAAIETKFVTAKIVGTMISPFTNYAIIQAGEKENVKLNDVIRGNKGLIGRVTEVGNNYSTIMLINDHNSRIPVITENTKTRGILTKQDNNLKIILRDIIDELFDKGEYISFDYISHKLLAYLACRSAVKAGDYLTQEQCQELIIKLKQTRNPYTCPHGRPTQVEVAINYFHTLFKRK